MKQILLILFEIIVLNTYSQNDSREWLNLKGEVKSLRQIKYHVTEDSVIQESSDKRRFGDVLFMSIGQQLLIDNSFILFSKSGQIKHWSEIDNNNDTITNLNFFYDNKLLPFKIEFVRGENISMTVNYELDNSGYFIGVNLDNISSQILRDEFKKVISEKLIRNSDTTTLKYEYQPDERLTFRCLMVKN